jgi:hypothetical protein
MEKRQKSLALGQYLFILKKILEGEMALKPKNLLLEILPIRKSTCINTEYSLWIPYQLNK